MQSLMLDLSAALCKLYCSTIWKLEVINRGLEVTPRAICVGERIEEVLKERKGNTATANYHSSFCS